MAERIKRKISAILSADVVGYSKLMEADEETTVRTMESYRSTFTSIVEQHGGRVIDSPGDNILSEFGSVVDAVQCAVEIQHVIRAKNAVVPEARRMQFRIGISLEDIIEEEDRIYGDGVNIASRIEGLADAGGICISGAAYEQIKRKLALGYEDLGEHSVKNISWPVQVYRIPLDSGTASAASESKSPSLAEKPSIAVLPFDNLSSDPEQEYFSDGIVEEIIARLSVNSSLAVISRNSTFSYKDKRAKVTEVGRDLGARYVVEGSIRKAGNRIRITAQLIDATSAKHLWSKTYNRELADVFELQDEIAESIAVSLNAEYTGAELQRVRRIPTNDLTAYDTYLRGLNHVLQFSDTDWRKGVELFEKAIELDPEFPDAYAALADTLISAVGVGLDTNTDAFRDGMEYARKAISLDDSVVDAHVVLAQAYRFMNQYDQAITEIDRAISLNPSYPLAYIVKGAIFNTLKRSEEAVAVLKKAMHFDPVYDAWCLSELGWAYGDLGKYEESLAVLREALSQSPSFPVAYWALVYMYRLSGQDEKVIETVEEGISRNIMLPGWVVAAPAQIYRVSGQADMALAYLTRVESQCPDPKVILAEKAITYRSVGRYEDSVALLDSGLAADPDWSMGRWRLSETYRMSGQYGRAIEIAKEALSRDPSAPWPYGELAWCYLDKWETQHSDDSEILDKALVAAEQSIAMDEDDAAAHYALSRVHLKKNQFDESISEAEKTMALGGAGWSPVLGHTYNHIGRYEEAIALTEEALQVNSSDSGIHDTLGHGYRLSGRQSEAMASYMRVFNHDASHKHKVSAHVGLALLHAELGNEEEARSEAAEVLELVPHFSVDIWGERNPMKDREQIERDMAALRKAGLK